MAGTQNALFFLVTTLLELLIWLYWLRVLLQAVRAEFYNPISQFVFKATRYPTNWLSPVLPTVNRINLAAVAGLLAAGLLFIYAVTGLLNYTVPLHHALLYALLKLVLMLLGLYTFTLFIQAVMSWVGPGGYNPASALLFSLNEPLLRPVRNLLPPVGGLDLSPLVVILGLQVLARLISLPGVFR